MVSITIQTPWGADLNLDVDDSVTDDQIEQFIVGRYNALQDLTIRRARNEEGLDAQIAALKAELNITDDPAITRSVSPLPETEDFVEANLQQAIRSGEALPWGAAIDSGVNIPVAARSAKQALMNFATGVGEYADPLLQKAGLPPEFMQERRQYRDLEQAKTDYITEGAGGSALLGEIAGLAPIGAAAAAAFPQTALGTAAATFTTLAPELRGEGATSPELKAAGMAVGAGALQKIGGHILSAISGRKERLAEVEKILRENAADSRRLGFELGPEDGVGARKIITNKRMAKIADGLAEMGFSRRASAMVKSADQATMPKVKEMAEILKKGATNLDFAASNPTRQVVGDMLGTRIDFLAKAKDTVGKQLRDVVDFDLAKKSVDATKVRDSLEQFLSSRLRVDLPEDSAQRLSAATKNLYDDIDSITTKYGQRFDPRELLTPADLPDIDPKDAAKLNDLYGKWRKLPSKVGVSEEGLGFSKSAISGSPSTQKAVKDIFIKMDDIGDLSKANAKDLYNLRKDIDNNINFAKLGETGLEAQTQTMLKQARSEIDEILRDASSKYGDVATSYHELSEALGSFDDFVKPEVISALKSGDGLTGALYGRLLRRELGNAQSREPMIESRNLIEKMANKYAKKLKADVKFDDNIELANKISMEFEKLDPSSLSSSLRGQTEAGMQHAGTAAVNMKIGNPAGAAHGMARALRAFSKSTTPEEYALKRAKLIEDLINEGM